MSTPTSKKGEWQYLLFDCSCRSNQTRGIVIARSAASKNVCNWQARKVWFVLEKCCTFTFLIRQNTRIKWQKRLFNIKLWVQTMQDQQQEQQKRDFEEWFLILLTFNTCSCTWSACTSHTKMLSLQSSWVSSRPFMQPSNGIKCRYEQHQP